VMVGPLLVGHRAVQRPRSGCDDVRRWHRDPGQPRSRSTARAPGGDVRCGQ
jgi:hypothetical protein